MPWPRLLVLAVVVVLVSGQAAVGPDRGESANRQADLGQRPLHKFSNVDLDLYLRARAGRFAGARGRPDASEDIGHYAAKSVEQPFRLNAYRLDLAESDCVTFVERTLAMSLAHDWRSYYRLCNRLRFRNGRNDFLEANHFPLADWIPNNAWLLRDITAELGAAQAFDHTVYRKRFFSKLEFGEDDTKLGRAKAARKAAKIAAVPESETKTDFFLPREAVADALPRLCTGDVIFIIRIFERPGLKPWYDCDHVGLFRRGEDGGCSLVHSAPPCVRATDLATFVNAYSWVRGIKVLRVHKDARGIADREQNRPVDSVVVPNPEVEDGKVKALRRQRESPPRFGDEP